MFSIFCASFEGTVEHAKECFARCVRAMLGFDAIEPKKLEHGRKLTILGIDVQVGHKDITMWPTQQKVEQWTNELVEHDISGVMSPGAASKMAGRLNFATQHCFRRVGRAMVRPFYAKQYSKNRSGACDAALTGAIKWWIETFRKNLTQTISLKSSPKTVHMFCDASGSPPIVAAVLFFQGPR